MKHIEVDVSKLKALQDALPERIDQLLGHELAIPCEVEAKRSMEGIKSGIAYGTHIASAPGEAPAIDTGLLRASIQAKRITYAQTWVVNAGTDYAEGLEFGTPRIAPRPFMLPAAEKVVAALPDLKAIVED